MYAKLYFILFLIIKKRKRKKEKIKVLIDNLSIKFLNVAKDSFEVQDFYVSM